MQIMKTFFDLIGLAVSIAAIPTTNTKSSTIVAREVTTHGNFSLRCSNITPYGSSTSTIQAWCGNEDTDASSVQYISHIDLNLCLENIRGHIYSATSGDAMQSCELGPSGRNACPDCNGAWFVFNCKTSTDGPNTTSLVDLDRYIGLEQTTNANGEAVWVLSCSTNTLNIGQFDGCNKLGTSDPSC